MNNSNLDNSFFKRGKFNQLMYKNEFKRKLLSIIINMLTCKHKKSAEIGKY